MENNMFAMDRIVLGAPTVEVNTDEGFVVNGGFAVNGTITVNDAPLSSGITTMNPIGSTPNANGATISGSSLTMQPASATSGGVLTIGEQTIAGDKTLNGWLWSDSSYGVGGKNLFLGKTVYNTTNQIYEGTITIEDMGYPIFHMKPGPDGVLSESVYLGRGAGNIGGSVGNNTAVCVGTNAGAHMDNTTENTCIGWNAGGQITTGNENVAVGTYSLQFGTTGSQNTNVGYSSRVSSGTTSNGTAIGANTSVGNNGIAIGLNAANNGDNRIDIGDPTTGLTSCYIQGINGVTSTGAVAAYINSSGQLGTVVSSQRYKEKIQNITQQQANAFLSLQPRSFVLKKERDPTQSIQYGYIAEEVEPILPELIAYQPQKNKDGSICYDEKGNIEYTSIPESIQYHLAWPLLHDAVKRLSAQVESLEFRLNKKRKRKETNEESIKKQKI